LDKSTVAKDSLKGGSAAKIASVYSEPSWVANSVRVYRLPVDPWSRAVLRHHSQYISISRSSIVSALDRLKPATAKRQRRSESRGGAAWQGPPGLNRLPGRLRRPRLCGCWTGPCRTTGRL